MKITVQEIKQQYYDYLAEFDPTPIYGGDDYSYPMDIDTFVEEFFDNYILVV